MEKTICLGSAKKLKYVGGGRRKNEICGGIGKKIKICEGGPAKFSLPPPQDLKWNSPYTTALS